MTDQFSDRQIAMFIESDKIHKIEDWIKSPQNINRQIRYLGVDRTALSWAAVFNSFYVFDALIKRGADVNAQDSFGDTALSHLTYLGLDQIEEGRLKCIADLFEKNINVSLKDSEGLTVMDHLNKPSNRDNPYREITLKFINNQKHRPYSLKIMI